MTSLQDSVPLQVAWLENNSIPVTYEERRVIDDARFSVVRPSVTSWHLQVQDVKVEDAGHYRCTVNTRPVVSKLVWLLVTGNVGNVNSRLMAGSYSHCHNGV